MLAVFGKQRLDIPTPRSPPFVGPNGKRKAEFGFMRPEEEAFVYDVLDGCFFGHLPKRLRGFSRDLCLGGGANGLGYLESLDQQCETDGDVTLFLKGQLDRDAGDDGWAGMEGSSDAAFLLRQYRSAFDLRSLADTAPPMMAGLHRLEGSWTFVLFDRTYGRIVAARSREAGEPLFWTPRHAAAHGCASEDGPGALLFATDRGMLERGCGGGKAAEAKGGGRPVEGQGADASGSCPVEEFPAGSIFVSQEGETRGRLAPLAPVPRPKAALEEGGMSWSGGHGGGGDELLRALCRVDSGALSALSSSLSRTGSRASLAVAP